MQSAQVQVKPSRYWDERPAKNIPDDIFYSLSEYWPSMPIDVDIVSENTQLGLPLYRMNEQHKTNQSGHCLVQDRIWSTITRTLSISCSQQEQLQTNETRSRIT
jgi:hypothetical protein